MSLSLLKSFLNKPDKYYNWYCDIINNSIANTLTDTYVENHHIIPECFFINRNRKGQKGIIDGDSESKDNFVILTAREHYICHLLLCKMALPKILHQKAMAGMGGFMSRKEQRNLTPKQYARAKREFSQITRERMLFYKHSEETKRKMRKPKKDKSAYKNLQPVESSIGTIYMNNGIVSKRVHHRDIEQRLLEGFTKGKLLIRCIPCQKHMDIQNFKKYHKSCNQFG